MERKDTMHMISGFNDGEYSDPFVVRSLIAREGLLPESFADRLWQALVRAGGCPMLERLSEGGSAAVREALPEAHRAQWDAAVVGEPGGEPHAAALTAFLKRICVNKPLCRPCRCKERVIAFLAATGGGDAERARNAAKRNVSNWLTDKQPHERETCIKLCYALGMRVECPPSQREKDADRFLSLVCGQHPLHLSRPDEAIHYFCMKYPLGKELAIAENYDGVGGYRYAVSLIERVGEQPETAASDDWMFTMEASGQLRRLRTEKDVLAYAHACAGHESDEYYTARCVLRDFLSSREMERAISGDAPRSRSGGLTKETARRMVAAFERLDSDVSALEEIARGGVAELTDILCASGELTETEQQKRPVSRTLLLLCLLAQNCGVEYSAEQVDVVQTDDLTDIRSFNEFFRVLNTALENCSMAALNPRRRLDFLILYSYYLFSRDASVGELPDAFSVYMERAIKRIME